MVGTMKVTKSISKKDKTKGDPSASRSITVVGISGTPGCGKTTLAQKLEKNLGIEKYQFINIAELIKSRKLYSEWDDEMNCSIFDDKLVRREVEKLVYGAQDSGKSAVILEFHSLDFLRKKFLDKVFVLRTDTGILWQRLESRKYTEKKIKENVEAEIFMECFNDCQDKFGPESVECLDSNTEADMKKNMATIAAFIRNNID